MTAAPYPQDIKPLTSLRFIAAFWVLLYHFKDHLGLDLGRFGLIADGYLGVDLFFTLSGFILAHVYLESLQTGRFGYGGFLKNRLARVYPMHLAALAAMIVLFVGATTLGAGVGSPDAFKLSDLAAHLLMIHAWGATAAVGWNFPSWSISAEWAAYLLFPLIAALVLKARRPALIAAGALALCLASFAALDNLHAVLPGVGRDFSQMTAQIGALRILPSFLLGVALYAFGRATPAPKRWAWPIALISAAWIVVVTSFDLWEGLAWFGLAGLLYGLAETSRYQIDAPMAQRSFVFLGAASYALYMLHLPVDIVWFHALERFGVTENSDLTLRIATLVGVFVACIAASIVAYLWIEEPARNWVRKLDWPKPIPAPRLSGVRSR
ncbi:MAG: acyltransferase [Caulobacterales bacterium]|jgi:peptidoglycan/LPS O-acetylase OafA/YrhL|nr:acyltransferase [Caulobacterales bacterium]